MKESKRIYWIDALKGWAIVGTTLVHSAGKYIVNDSGKLAALSGAGARGCQLFFLINGLVLFISLNNTFGQNYEKMNIKSVGKWYIKRFIRLIPLYYFSIVVYLLTNQYSVYWLGSEGRVTPLNVIFHLLFIHGFNPYYIDSVLGVDWYIADFAIFIVLAPLLYKIIRSFTDALYYTVIALTIAFFSSTILMKIYPLSSPEDGYIWSTYATSFGFLNQLPTMLLGVLLFFIIYRIDIGKKVNNKKSLSVLLFVTSVIFLYGLIFHGASIPYVSVFTMYGIGFFVLALSLVFSKNKVIDNKIIRTVGKYSYPTYLFNFMLIKGCQHIPINISVPWLAVLIQLIFITFVGLLFSFVMTKVIEDPCIKGLKKIAFRRKQISSPKI